MKEITRNLAVLSEPAVRENLSTRLSRARHNQQPDVSLSAVNAGTRDGVEAKFSMKGK